MDKGNTHGIIIVVFNAAGIPVLQQRLNLQHADAAFAVTGTDKLPEGNYTITITWESGKRTTTGFTKRTG